MEQHKIDHSRLLRQPIETIVDDTRLLNAFKRYDIKTVSDIVTKDENDILRMDGIAKRSLALLQKSLERHNLSLSSRVHRPVQLNASVQCPKCNATEGIIITAMLSTVKGNNGRKDWGLILNGSDTKHYCTQCHHVFYCKP